jgi:hypothetical protein
MEVAKNFTDIEQSKNLLKYLSIESSDGYYPYILPGSGDNILKRVPELGNPVRALEWYNKGYTLSGKKVQLSLEDFCIPAWSLAALLGVLPDIAPLTIERVKAEDGYDGYYYHIEYKDVLLVPYRKSQLDACYEMITRLHEHCLL